MKEIIDFLKSSIDGEMELNNIQINHQDIYALNQKFKGLASFSTISILPPKRQSQIWTVKKEYIDYLGEFQKTNHQLMVILTSDPECIDEDEFVRACPISPFVEMATENDQICEDSSVVGFPFLVEVWNEQPLLTEILDKYVGSYFTDLSVSVSEIQISEDQRMFREIEISNAMFLNHSVNAFINELNRKENFSFSVDLCFAERVKTKRMPEANTVFDPSKIRLFGNEEFASAARVGCRIDENDCIDFEEQDLPFRIEVRKRSGSYILTIIPKVEVSLMNSHQEQILGFSNSERIVYDGLKKGIYTIITRQTEKTITIRLR
jgi:hypothetical protein